MAKVRYVAVGISCLLLGFLAHAQVAQLDRTKPEAVARAYLDACEKADVETALGCLDAKDETEAVRFLLRDERPRDYADQMVTELLLLPLLKNAKYAAGEVAINGDKAQLPVTVTLPLTLVLKKGPDGNWMVHVRESMAASTGLAEPYFLRSLEEAVLAACQSNLKQLAQGVLMWAQDHDQNLPPAENWIQELMPYLKDDQMFRCPGAPELECGYAYNLELAGRKLADIANPAEAVLFYESSLGMPNAADMGETQPPAGRHNGGNSFAYVDGHVRWDPAKGP